VTEQRHIAGRRGILGKNIAGSRYREETDQQNRSKFPHKLSTSLQDFRYKEYIPLPAYASR
jgi:hypothetical protein